MISAAKAYLISKDVGYDKTVVIEELKSIENKIQVHAKRLGATSVKYKIDLSVPNKNLFATYAKLMNQLRRSHYQVSLQSEKYRATEKEYCLLKSNDEREKALGWMMFDDRLDKCGTYLYISWGKRKENG